MELERATRRPHSPIYRELRRLASVGIVRATLQEGRRHYEPIADDPIGRGLVGLVLQTRGRVPRIRHSLIQLRSRTVAWVVAGGAAVPRADDHGRPRNALIVLTSAPKSLVRVQMTDLIGSGMELHCMSVSEWMARLEKGDVFLRKARRARKLWILGGWDELVRRERSQVESRRTLGTAMANWREHLSDEWDEDWDPFAPVPS